ncbi:hypothetical protein [Hydrogenophaga atypica]|uniref:Lipoprotein n=1 Tax=Hydrogenophaga atypica TaxID=249409 RepID=A0ABW2QQ87_9BURK
MGSNSRKIARAVVVGLALAGLSACVATAPRVQYVQRAQNAIAVANYEGAYRALEDGFLDPDPEVKGASIQLYRSNPKLRDAAIASFSGDELATAFNVYRENTAVALLRNRLRLFAQVASPEELTTAYGNFETVEKNHKEIAADKKKKAEDDERSARETQARETAMLIKAVETARQAATFHCADRLACEKSFALTQVFITTHSDMKIQMANDTIIQTYNPTDTFAMGASAVKMPRSGTSADILLTITCKGKATTEQKICMEKSATMYRAFPTFMKANFVQ